VSGARLAAKYLDKELAGRIQQLQLFGRDMKGELRDKLWRQLEAEILLQRHKTVVRACRNNSTYQQEQRLRRMANAANNNTSTGSTNTANETPSSLPSAEMAPPAIRVVPVPRAPGEGLGMSITVSFTPFGFPFLFSIFGAVKRPAKTT